MQYSKAKGIYCAAKNCVNNQGQCNLSFFRFPKDNKRSKIWILNARRIDLGKIKQEKLSNYYFCSNHFEASEFMNSNKNKLIWNAIPTLFDIPNPPKSLNKNSQRARRLKRRRNISETTETNVEPTKTKSLTDSCTDKLPKSIDTSFSGISSSASTTKVTEKSTGRIFTSMSIANPRKGSRCKKPR